MQPTSGWRVCESVVRIVENTTPVLDDGLAMSSPARIAQAFRFLETSPVEHVWAAGLDTKHKLVSAWLVSTGTLGSALVHPREVFGPALRLGAVAALILVHNHPSGDPEPSMEDHEAHRPSHVG